MTPTKQRLRWITSLVVAPVTFLSLALAAGLPAQAAAASTAGPGHHAQTQHKSIAAHTKPAACNRLQPQTGGKHFARCFAVGLTNSKHKLLALDDPPDTATTPAELQDAYNLPDTGDGQTVAIVDAFGYDNAESDLAVFRAAYGLPPCTTANGCFQKVDQNGGTDYPPQDEGWSIEQALDVNAVSAVCPNCNILLVQGDDNSFDSLGIAVQTAVSMGAKYVSNSYGVAGEFDGETDLDFYYDHPGVVVTVSTGDIGGVQSWPATNPHVTAVGGTTLTPDGSPRGWTETAWADGGSGCSVFEAKPDYQEGIDTECDNRANADVSADADPETGLAVYNTLGQDGWGQWGGTSLSSPLLAGMYALAGTPVADTYPVEYPYAAPGSFNDVTEGSNDSCGNVLCEAGPGWDGPTGLGTPAGVQGLTTGPHGTIKGHVKDAGTGDPIAGASVFSPAGYSATTNAAGDYTMSVPVGHYQLRAAAFGYKTKIKYGVQVTDGGTTTKNYALNSVPTHVVSGTVTDGSGAGWPLYAKITIDGYPHGAIWTSPYDGKYSVTLPEGDITMHVASNYPGYAGKDVNVHVGTSNATKDVAVPVDVSTCTAPGYSYSYSGTGEQFTGWTGTDTQDGWTQVDNEGNGEIWNFDNPGGRTPPPGSDGDMAAEDSDFYGPDEVQDASLVSPTIDLSAEDSPEIGFDTDYTAFLDVQTADVDLSIDNGSTWTNVWHQDTSDFVGNVSLPIPSAANKSQVKVRFHYTSAFGFFWLLDNVFVGTRSCVWSQGGLVAGVVRDNNTNAPLNGAKVARANHPDEFGGTQATPDDPNLSDGFYWLYTSKSGTNTLKATDGKYTPKTSSLNVPNGGVAQKNWKLEAGHLTVTPGGFETTVKFGNTKTGTVTIGNDGTQPVHVVLGERNGGFEPMAGIHATRRGAPVQHIAGRYTTHSMMTVKNPARMGPSGHKSTPFDAPWTDIADYPIGVEDNLAAANDGLVYSAFGFDGGGDVASGYVYDPAAGSWSPIADAPETREQPRGGFIDGIWYVAGGWDPDGNASTTLWAYDPGADSWTQKADIPEGVSAAGSAILDGQLYLVGGCTTGNCAPTTTSVYSYDPGSDSWTQHADLPAPEAFMGCAGISGEVVCAGGINADTSATSTATYVLDPGSDSWTQVADMPMDLWGGASIGANDQLLMSNGVTDDSNTVTNQGLAYDPGSDSWTALPNSNTATFRGSGACGFYKIGGVDDNGPSQIGEVLPGYDQCGAATDVPWFSEDPVEFDVAPGAHVTVSITVDASAVSQPGTYVGSLGLNTDSPYSYTPVGVTMHVTPPAAWGKVRGTVVADANGAPIPGATVQICTMFDKQSGNCGPVSYTLKTDADGYFQLWLNKGFNPLEIIAAKDGYQPQLKIVKITAGGTTNANFSLKKS